jgi:pimeloyl-ACP methyl ester carboxylesterase
MVRHRGAALALAVLLAAAGSTAQATDSRLISIKTPRGVKQAFILITPAKPVAAVILFAGGDGGLGLKSASSMAWGASNFLVRTRDIFAARGFAVAVVDAPSDHRKMNAIFRMSIAHAGDIAAVAAYLKKQANVPVWLVGTSMGTFSAAEGAIVAGDVDGLVLTSTITHSPPKWKIAHSYPNGVASMMLSRITVPTLIVSHRKDGCDASPASAAPKLKSELTKARKVEIVLIDGGKPPRSKPCEAKAQHGYYGVETKAVDRIAAFIKANSK